jgi:pyruvate,water dikinase
MDREFIAPGPGTWQLDTTHNAAAMTPMVGESFAGLARGFKEGCRRYGLMMSHLQPSFQHGFMFMQQVGAVGKPGGNPPPPAIMKLMFKIHPELRRRVKAAHESFINRLWLQDLKDWDQMKQDSIARNTSLQSVDLQSLDDAGLITHLIACRDNAREMVYRHHKFTVGSIMPVGWLLDVATRNSGLSYAEVAPLLKGSTPVSTGIGGEQLARLAEQIRAAGLSKADLDARSPEEALSLLRETPQIAAALDEYLAVTGYMLIGGYCISEKTLRESPNIILARIGDALTPRAEQEFDTVLEQRVRDSIPQADRAEFEQALSDARETNRMRDERGVYNDIWGTGIARTAILEAGRRLVEKGMLTNSELALDASHDEIIGLLRGENPVAEAALQERRNWRLTKKIDEVPLFLGDPPGAPPPLELLPEKLRPTMRAFAAVMGNVFDSPDEASEEKIEGLPVSPGVYEGTARVIVTTREFDRLQEGDILVTKNTSAGFNVVLPIIGALVTDRGGILSHAAIVSREYGIPGVIGTKTATQRINDGDRIRVDGDKGEVTVLS